MFVETFDVVLKLFCGMEEIVFVIIEIVVFTFQIDLVNVALHSLKWSKVRRLDFAILTYFSPDLLGN